MKKSFISAMQKLGLHVITKARDDANMKYLYHGPQSTGKGRDKQFAGKVKWNRIDKRRWKVCHEDEDLIVYELIVWSVLYVWHIRNGQSFLQIELSEFPMHMEKPFSIDTNFFLSPVLYN